MRLGTAAGRNANPYVPVSPLCEGESWCAITSARGRGRRERLHYLRHLLPAIPEAPGGARFDHLTLSRLCKKPTAWRFCERAWFDARYRRLPPRRCSTSSRGWTQVARAYLSAGLAVDHRFLVSASTCDRRVRPRRARPPRDAGVPDLDRAHHGGRERRMSTARCRDLQSGEAQARCRWSLQRCSPRDRRAHGITIANACNQPGTPN